MAEDGVSKLVVLGGSAGSLDVILDILPAFPLPGDAAFLVVLHRKSDPDSTLSNIMQYRTALQVREIEDKEPIRPGYIYLAPGDYHVLLESNTTFALDSSEKVHHCRPSIDVTFESVAQVMGDKGIGILLSGANADGAAGLQKIFMAGGQTLVQDPATADVDFMPRQALLVNPEHQVANEKDIPKWIIEALATESS